MAKATIVRGDPDMVPRLRDGRPRVQCPAARAVAGATRCGGGVVCVIYEQDRAKESGQGISAGQLAVARGDSESDERGGGGGTYMTALSDPTVIARLCCGTDLPVPDHGGQYARDHFSYCPVWQAEWLRIQEGREQLRRVTEPEPVIAPCTDPAVVADLLEPEEM